MFCKVLHRRTTLSAASRSENSYLREAIGGGTIALAPRLSVINANGETDICGVIVHGGAARMQCIALFYGGMRPIQRSLCKTMESVRLPAKLSLVKEGQKKN